MELNKNIVNAFLIAFFVFFLQSANASLTIIKDFGGVPAIDVIQQILPKDTPPPKKEVDLQKEINSTIQFPFKAIAIPGKVTDRDFESTLTTLLNPIALMGTDKRSMRWLSSNKKQLIALNTTVFIVSARSKSDLHQVINSYGGKVIPLTKSDIIFKKFKIVNYPVLITQDGVYQ